MKLDLIPLLRAQRKLYHIPPGMTRFKSYIEVTTGGAQDIILPLAVMNPMGKPQVAARLDELIAVAAEEAAAVAVKEARERLSHLQGRLWVGLLVADDAEGGWLNRYLTETRPSLRKQG